MTNSGQLLNTSICKIKHASLQHATSFRLYRDSMLSVPRSIMLDGVISYGGSTGSGLNAVRKAFGEYYERNHFFTAVPITSQKKLTDVIPQTHQKKLMGLCDETNSNALNSHPFSFTTVYNLFDNTPIDYLYNAISLRGVKADAAFINMTDSCGCASHSSKPLALHHSLIEFLERQALLGSWLSKTYHYSINPHVLKNISPYTALVDQFIDNGDLYIFEIGNHLPGYNVIIFYFAHSSNDAVQYSVGSKSGGSLASALASAFEELYQSYTFLYSAVFKTASLENKAGAEYHQAFMQYNNQNTKSLIPFINQVQPFEVNTIDDVHALPVVSDQTIIQEIQHITSDVYYYHYYDNALQLHFTKILSPDFFAHMSLGKRLNFNGLYPKKLNITQDNAYLEMLPFP